MKTARLTILFSLAALVVGTAQAETAPTQTSPLDRVVQTIVERETALAGKLRGYRPLVETYMQTLQSDDRVGAVPVSDDYFLGRLDLSGKMTPHSTIAGFRQARKPLDVFKDFYANGFQPDGFARMLVLDSESFDREHYDFEFVKREFLGEVRTLVFEVVPKDKTTPGRFIGRIWADDRDFNIVRCNGVYTSQNNDNLHFDSWRLEMEKGLWFPAYVYTEESDPASTARIRPKFKGQTRIWGYEPPRHGGEEEFTKLLIEDTAATGGTEHAGDLSPVRSQRAWEREAEDNVIRRLEKSSIIAPAGDVDAVLDTVVSNLEVTNGLDIDPPVRCRVLLTTPLESFTVGHTIVVSRGLIDVLPDEASLAMVLAHELGHILLGHQLDTKYAFGDQMLVGDKQTLKQFDFRRDPAEEADADDRAVLLLEKSPYKGKLGNAGLFLKALASRSTALPALIRPHFGNRMAKNDKKFRMNRIIDGAPELNPEALNQTAALPLGGRVKVDPWSARIELMKGGQPALISAHEKLPFEVTPLMPYLVRLGETTPVAQPAVTPVAQPTAVAQPAAPPVAEPAAVAQPAAPPVAEPTAPTPAAADTATAMTAHAQPEAAPTPQTP